METFLRTQITKYSLQSLGLQESTVRTYDRHEYLSTRPLVDWLQCLYMPVMATVCYRLLRPLMFRVLHYSMKFIQK